jgi:FkbM family methyltransferase
MTDQISYAYNHEDVLLARVFAGQQVGYFIDVGANHPIEGSVTKLLSDRGWSGVNIEPNRRLADALRRERPRDITLNVGVASRAGSMELHEVQDEPGLSTMNADHARDYRQRGRPIRSYEVEVRTLASICEEHVGATAIDFLTIDVEGFEREVLLGADFTRWRPRVLVVEATLPYTNTPVHAEWEGIVLDAGYHFAFFDGINRFYISARDPGLEERLSFPVTPLDGFVSHAQYQLQQRAAVCGEYGRAAHAAARVTQRAVRLLKSVVPRTRSTKNV